ncbi:hypothetical protein [Desulfolutivibrio sulfoxidireducens]|uniref:hypothetical protein n=1 Tax=Desulfolutivibrio sulfoxidireducens TaxID=2773299 RepID=UPI001C3FFD69|nr:hypothetical protein [Desulfolutivibrio sulfoxidireducens]QLA18671.1 hypothetical protein GD604_02460 [Desulfolutivibrio sulfoxidireducens]
MEPGEMMLHAVRPTLFSATARPELVTATFLANLMSESLWALGRQIVHSAGRPSTTEELAKRMAALHKFVNGHFYHPTPMVFGRTWGLQERDRITKKEDMEANDYVMDFLAKAFEQTGKRFSFSPLMLEFLKMGAFPQYVYPTIDVILAHGHLLRDIPSRPRGMTSCLDECLLLAALALATQSCSPHDIVFLGSPLHYTLFLFPEGTNGYWFNAKREFFDAESWASLCRESGGSSNRELFYDKMYLYDRLISLRGYCIFPKGRSTFPAGLLGTLTGKIERFLGAALEWTRAGIDLALDDRSVEADEERIITAIDRCASGAEVREGLRRVMAQGPSPLALASMYAFRSVDVPDRGNYVSAALNDYKTYVLAATILGFEDALSLVRGIPGRESILKGPERIALPDEVMFFRAASEKERLLLLYTLLMHSPSFSEAEKAEAHISTDGEHWTLRWLGIEFHGCDLFASS